MTKDEIEGAIARAPRTTGQMLENRKAWLVIRVGDEVAYSARWLRACALYTGPMPARRGVVVALEPFGQTTMATIAWDDGLTDTAITPNLTLVTRLGADAALADRVHQSA